MRLRSISILILSAFWLLTGAPLRALERVISLAPSVTSIIKALDAKDTLVGVTRFCEASDIPKVGGLSDPSYERILELKPEAVFLSELSGARTCLKLDTLGLPCYTFSHQGISGLLEDIKSLGELLDKEAEASALIDSFEGRIQAVQSAVAPLKRPSVLVLLSPHDTFSPGPGSFLDDLVGIAGGANIVDKGLTSWPRLSREYILQKDPDVIIIAGEGDCLPSMEQDSFWRLLRAVKTKRVYTIPQKLLTIPGPASLEALEHIAACLHPESF